MFVWGGVGFCDLGVSILGSRAVLLFSAFVLGVCMDLGLRVVGFDG